MFVMMQTACYFSFGIVLISNSQNKLIKEHNNRFVWIKQVRTIVMVGVGGII